MQAAAVPVEYDRDDFSGGTCCPVHDLFLSVDRFRTGGNLTKP